MSWRGAMNLAQVEMLERTFATFKSYPVTWPDGSRGEITRWEVPAWVCSLRRKVEQYTKAVTQ